MCLIEKPNNAEWVCLELKSNSAASHNDNNKMEIFGGKIYFQCIEGPRTERITKVKRNIFVENENLLNWLLIIERAESEENALKELCKRELGEWKVQVKYLRVGT